MDNTFLWHDYETFGKVARSDRPAQFAAIRTDMDLNEIEKPIMWYCKPTPDVLPSIEACLITGITPQHCLEHGVIEREFALHIERELAKEQTIGVGFNSIRFDDEVTRHLFWRNLIDPYAREWQNGCGRWDLMDVVRALYAFLPESINWLQNEDDVVSFKLESLSKANHLSHDQAHDALSDVRATIALAKLIKTTQPKFFNFCLNLRDKKNVRMQLQEKRPVLHVSSMYGVQRAHLAVVWPLAEHPTNKNEVIVWDLAEDPSILANLTGEEIKARVFTKENRLPIKT
ncbi:MAG: exodeoxyribonuclease I, partial [Gammaproteobacteria bacterium]|nr:exodeoxyribonuclease I [Gammaproteobacteria bacterium]